MALPNVIDSTQELLDAQTQVWNHIFSYINSMSLKSALQLGIPDAIHKHGKPITLALLADALSINKAKSDGLFRLMRILVHSRIFDKVKISRDEGEDEEEAYFLTRVSRLLLRDEPSSFAPYALAMLDPNITDPFHNLNEWFQDDCPSPFFTRNGRRFFEVLGNDEKWNQLFNEAMACDAHFVGSLLVKECKQFFEGLESVVDVAGGTGEVAKAVFAAFPDLKCIVLNLPHVIDGLEGSQNLSFVSGDMFEFIPPADAVFLKWILHDWSDEECIMILGKCKEAITQSKRNGGKVIIVDMIVNDEREEEHQVIKSQLHLDILMMTLLTGKERTEKEWALLFTVAGFKNYKITRILGSRYAIELFP